MLQERFTGPSKSVGNDNIAEASRTFQMTEKLPSELAHSLRVREVLTEKNICKRVDNCCIMCSKYSEIKTNEKVT